MTPNLERLSTISHRLRTRANIDRREILRDGNGRIVGMEGTVDMFQAEPLIHEGFALYLELQAERDDDDNAQLYRAAILVEFLEAARPFLGEKSRALFQQAALLGRKSLAEAGVEYA